MISGKYSLFRYQLLAGWKKDNKKGKGAFTFWFYSVGMERNRQEIINSVNDMSQTSTFGWWKIFRNKKHTKAD